jgi:hypothetical protein
VHAEYLVVDEGCNRHAVEHVLEFFPDADAISPLALVVESVDSVNLAALMVSAEQEKVLFEFHFVGEEQYHSLK